MQKGLAGQPNFPMDTLGNSEKWWTLNEPDPTNLR
jgi:hypothetical protein